MPGTFAVDQAATFTSVTLINSGPKPKFGASDQYETNSQGVPKWLIEAAVTFTPTVAGMRPVSELITITITDHSNPADGMAPGTAVAFEALRVGLNPPERNDKGGIKGGKLWYTATGLRSASAVSSRRSSENAA